MLNKPLIIDRIETDLLNVERSKLLNNTVKYYCDIGIFPIHNDYFKIHDQNVSLTE